MSLGLEDVKHIARLARIEITDDASQDYLARLAAIFTLIEEMQAVETTGIEPMAHALDMTARLREDHVTESNQREAFQAVAPHVAAGLYLVPRVIE